jgi:hypothetical protein
MPLYEDNRACTKCGIMGFTRHTCPSCPCNYCKKDGHTADNCTKAQKAKSRRPGGSFADRDLASGRPLSNPFSITPRNNHLRLPPRHNAEVTAGSNAAPASSADGGESPSSSSDSPSRHSSQHSPALDTSLSLKRKMTQISTTTPTTLTPNLLSDVSPLLDAEVGHPERLESFRLI